MFMEMTWADGQGRQVDDIDLGEVIVWDSGHVEFGESGARVVLSFEELRRLFGGVLRSGRCRVGIRDDVKGGAAPEPNA